MPSMGVSKGVSIIRRVLCIFLIFIVIRLGPQGSCRN